MEHKVGVNPEILKKNSAVTFKLYPWCKGVHFWNEHKSENPFLASNCTKMSICFLVNGKISLFCSLFQVKGLQKQFWVKMLKIAWRWWKDKYLQGVLSFFLIVRPYVWKFWPKVPKNCFLDQKRIYQGKLGLKTCQKENGRKMCESGLKPLKWVENKSVKFEFMKAWIFAKEDNLTSIENMYTIYDIFGKILQL